MSFSVEQQALILSLARQFIRHALQGTTPPPFENSDSALCQPAGCFVSLHTLRDRRLRGCVGQIDANQPLIEALQSVSAQVLHDPRFTTRPVRWDELPHLEIEVSVLSAPHPAPDPLGFDPQEHGIHLTIGSRAGCFLPQVARETGWTREQLLDRLCTEKLGLHPCSWRAPEARLHLFSVLIVGPETFESSAVGSNWKTL